MLRYIFRDLLVYNKWIKSLQKTNIPVIEVESASVIKNISKLPLGFDPDMQIYMAYIHPHNFQMAEAMIIGIPINSSSKSHRHIYGEEIVVLSGVGYTELKQNRRFPQTIQWNEGSYFFIPASLEHRHFNTGDKPVRFLVVTPAPLFINLFGNRRILYNIYCPFIRGINVLKQTKSLASNKNYLETYFIEDIAKAQIPSSDYIGKGYRYIQFRGNILRNILHSTHIAELRGGTYIRAHKHGGDVFIYILSGKGYTLIGEKGEFRIKKRIDWEAGDLINLPPWQYHQKFSTGSKPARFIAFKGALSLTMFVTLTKIPYDKEDVNIKKAFEKELSISGDQELINRYKEWENKAEEKNRCFL